MSQTLYEKVWRAHAVETLPDGRVQLFIGLHLIHEVTSPQAFAVLRERGLPVAMPEHTMALVDHVVPTDGRPWSDPAAIAMAEALAFNTNAHGIRYLGPGSNRRGIVHVVGPELGLTWPGMTIACGDSHTSTHGAFGAVAMGIGTSQVRDVLATQTLAFRPNRVRRITVTGQLGCGVTAKDLALHLIASLGVRSGAGFAHEYGGSAIEALDMSGRMTLCNMAIEGGARVGYVNPDETTFRWLKGRPFAPIEWERAVRAWRAMASDPEAVYDDIRVVDATEVAPRVTWGVHPGQSAPVDGRVPLRTEVAPGSREAWADALAYMKLAPGQSMESIRVDVAFIGSCTNSRLEDLRDAARVLRGRKVSRSVRALAVPGSAAVKRAAEAEGLDAVFRDAGFEWREPGCSMCLAMNGDRLVGDELCASSSNRNFKGRQGSPTGRTVLLSPAGVAAAAVCGHITDPRSLTAPGGVS